MTIEQAVYEITHTASYNERLWAIEEIIQSLKMSPQKQIQMTKKMNRF
ncbi:hypothetical protein LP097_06170 [Moraxella bovis]|nr:hypothetical protein [Moraxella bovis]UZA31166.1 hypothetical protein LP097_06170 [Moraxella bovis]